MNVSLQTFGGLIPRVAPSLLPETGATVANNCRLRSGKFSPLKQSLAVTDYKVRLENDLLDMADAKTLYMWKRGARQEFLAWPGHVTVASGNIADDDRYRVFVAGETGVAGETVETPPAPSLSGNVSNVKFVVRYDTTTAGECSALTDNYNIRGYNASVHFSEVDIPVAAVTRTIYKVISVDGSNATVVTQVAWTQAKEAGWQGFSIFVDDRDNETSVVLAVTSLAKPVIIIAASAPIPGVITVPFGLTSCVFVQTYIDVYGRESLPSPVSIERPYMADQIPLWADLAAAITGAPTGVASRRIYKVIGGYGDKIYVTTKAAWSQDVGGGNFATLSIAYDTTTDGEKQTLYFTNQYLNQPCVYVSAIDSGGFDRHSICLEKLPACVVARTATGTAPLNAAFDPDKARYTYFSQTWVDEYGYESPVSDSSAEVIYNDGDSMDITAVNPVPTGAVKRRVYKVITGTATESIQFVWEQEKDANSNEFSVASFTVKDENAADILISMTQCPKDLTWIVNMPGNFYAGFTSNQKRQIVFSAINIPTSYPLAYRYDIREDAVGLAVSGNTLFVLTVGQPYAISGTDPASVTISRIASNQGCVSKYSICSMNNAIFYASQDGVCMLSEGSQSEIVMTKDLFLREQWLALNPSSCLMVAHDTALHLFFEKTDGTRVSYILDLIDSPPTLTTHDDVASAVHADVESDGLYMIKEATV